MKIITYYFNGEKMKTVIKIVLCVLITGCLISYLGCKKQSEPQPPSTPENTVTQQTNSAPVVSAQETATATTAPITITKLSETALAAVPLDNVKAEVAKLNIEQLKARATEYKDAIVAKKAELTATTAKLKEIPVTQLLSTDAKTLQSNISSTTKLVSDLTERFQIYNNKIKELGGSIIE